MTACVGDLIKYYRKEKGISQEKLAEEAGCTREYIGKLEKNKNSPTIETLALIAQKLNVDLFDAYSEINEYNNFEIALKVKMLSDAMGRRDVDRIVSLVSSYSGDEGFKTGNPSKVLLYAKAIIISTVYKDNQKAIECIYKALCEEYQEFPSFKSVPLRLSNIEFTLLFAYGGLLQRIKKYDEAEEIFEEILERLKRLLEKEGYESEKRRFFWLNLYCSCTYNMVIYSNKLPQILIKKVDTVLDYQKKNKRANMLAELSLAKALLLKKNGQEKEYRTNLQIARGLGKFYWGDEAYTKFEQAVARQFNIEILE